MSGYLKSGGVCISADFIRSFGSVTDFLNACDFDFDTPENMKIILKKLYYEANGKAPRVATPQHKAGSKRSGKGA